jgi:DNA-binding SARP family transcriptional activator
VIAVATRFCLLGPVEVRADGQVIDVGPARRRCVLTVLLLDANQSVSTEQLVDRVWGDQRLPDRPRYAVATYVSLLRRALAEVGELTIVSQPNGYRAVVDERLVDVREFRRLIGEARATVNDQAAIKAFGAALGLWRGPAFGVLDTPWLASVGATLETERLAAERDLTDARLRADQHSALLAPLSEWAGQHPLDERLVGQLMVALYRSGRQADALTQYERTRVLLASELGVDPSPALRDLHQQILAADAALTPGPAVPSSQPAPPAAPDPPAAGAVAARNSPPASRAASASGNRLQRQLMIARQKVIWIDGALAQSFGIVSRIELRLTSKPDVVQRPWARVFRDAVSSTSVIDPDATIGEVFDQTGGALLILGTPGGGKTTLMLELAAELIARAENDEELPIPVVFNLSTWRRSLKSLELWLEDELHRRYVVPRRLARQWLADDIIVPLLDGLDEVKTEERGLCITAINKFVADHGLLQIAVCSRVADYEEVGSRLKLNTAVEIQPIAPVQVLSHLAAAGGPLEGLHSALATDRELLELLSTPLLLSVATSAYQNTTIGELTARATGGDRRQELIESYIRRALQRRSAHGPYPPDKALAWLGALAYQMSRHDQAVYYVEWTQPTWLRGRLLRAAAAWAFPALLACLVGLVTGYTIDLANRTGARLFGRGNDIHVAGISAGWFTGAVIGVLVLAFSFDRAVRPAETITWSLRSLRSNAPRQARSGLITGTVTAAAVGTIMQVWGAATVVFFVALFELLSVAFYVAVGGISPAFRDMRTVPNEGIHRSLRNALLIGIPGGVFVGVIAGYAFGVRLTLRFGLIDGLVVGGSVFVLTAVYAGGRAWMHHFALRCALIISGQIPVRWVRFLHYATDNILLYRIGGGYAFTHRIFLEYFVRLHLSLPADERAKAETMRPARPRVTRRWGE